MWGKKRREAMDAAASLEPAFSQLDMFAGKLDSLKQRFNDTAKELQEIKAPAPLDIPTPALSFMPPLSSLPPVPPRPEAKPEGRYSFNNPPEPRTLRPVPPPLPPRPRPKKPPPPKRTSSGRFYIQVSNAKDSTALSAVREQFSKCGRVVDSGKGTASDPDAGWLEVAVRNEDTHSFIDKLEGMEMKSRVEKLIEVAPGEGRIQAKQMDLFRGKQDSEAEI